ncbi:MAG: type I glyceraldehyde-3-phosphate dehydrogenase [Holosporaceae bacterium]|jgi:glyceraldehyde 3-phosphate dehydrogenase|nr:type I glyceraldehyde-3-phosphate dehydrogenase [Holosporaceae bacterium]
MRIAINGFGRIGRSVLRAYFEREKRNFEIVAVNDLMPLDASVHLLKYDSIYGRFSPEVRIADESSFVVQREKIKYFSEKKPLTLPWRQLGVDLVLECSGVIKTRKACEDHLTAGARKVLLSCPAEDADKTVVYGVNSDDIDVTKDVIISNASCTTNCTAPLVKIILEKVDIVSGFINTVHSYTADQRLMDSGHKDLRRARAALQNIIPTSTGVSKAIEQIFPHLRHKLFGLSLRVPTPDVSLVDFTFSTNHEISAQDLNLAIIKSADENMKGIVGYSHEPLTSSDFIKNPLSAIVEANLTESSGRLARIIAWYDNEWGFSNRMLDVASIMF